MIELKNIHKYYDYKKSNQVEALKGINLTINDGEMVAIMGASGAGKSTLLHIIGGLSGFESGQYLYNGKDISKYGDAKMCKFRNEQIGIVLQNFALIDEYSVLFNAMTPLFFAKCSIIDRHKRAVEALKTVGIDKLKHKSASSISGGEKQRCAIARAIVNKPSVILADEPTGQLDSKTAKSIIELFKTLNSTGITVIIVTHDQNVASECERIITIGDGVIM